MIAQLQRTLDVYEGLFLRVQDAKIIMESFNEIGDTLKRSLSTHIIIGCAAIFSDSDKTCGHENMSLKNIISKHQHNFSEETKQLYNDIILLVDEMNLKNYRNKHVGHFGLDESLGNKQVKRDITTTNTRKLLESSQILLNDIINDSSLLPKGHIVAYYTPIPQRRAPQRFLEKLKL
ncbi:hypothetical protein C9E85_05395 [Plesiomonas shigelloides]|nr:hypothetical protein C9E85_05395 [Plesiomonas shigelloides]